MVIPIKEAVINYGNKIMNSLAEEGFRVEIDTRNETLDKKIRNAELDKIPYSLVIGEREEKTNSISVRKKGKGNVGTASLSDFIKQVKKETEGKVIL